MVQGFNGAAYDSWLLNQAEEATRPCEPEVIRAEQEYEGPGEYSTSYTYNCEECSERDCEYWADYNDSEEEGENE